MATIAPISDLRNYGTVLEKVEQGKPVYLTRNGRGAYSIRDMEDELPTIIDYAMKAKHNGKPDSCHICCDVDLDILSRKRYNIRR